MARILEPVRDDATGLLVRVAKAVALLELIQETVPTDARLVAQCLYDRLDRGNQFGPVTEALEELRRRNLLGYSEKQGYKIQSSAGEEWERERRDIGVPRETIGELVQDSLRYLLSAPERPRLEGRPFPWAGVLSDGRRLQDVVLADPHDEAAVRVDFRFLTQEERAESEWVRRSADDPALADRLVWVCGEVDQVEHSARELARSQAMVKKFKPRRESLNAARKLLLQQEENREEDLAVAARAAVAAAWMAGRFYFRGLPMTPSEHGVAFAGALSSVAGGALPKLFPHFVPTTVVPSELLQLIEPELSGPSPKFLPEDSGILELDSGRYVPACGGVVPSRVFEHIVAQGGLSGTGLLADFARPPYGYTANVVKACAAGLLRAGKLRIQPESGSEITAVRDAGVRDLFDKDRSFRRATFFPAETDDDLGPQVRARICKVFEHLLGHKMDCEDHAIADAVSLHFPQQAQRLRRVLSQLDRLPGGTQPPQALSRLGDVLEQCVRSCRQTRPTVKLVKKHLDALRDGIQLLNVYHAELTDDALQAVQNAANVERFQAAQLREAGALSPSAEDAARRVALHLAGDQPWRELASLDPDLAVLRDAYVQERKRLLESQEREAEQARKRVKARDGFATLSAEHSHQVLRPITQAQTETTAEAVAPSLAALKDPFLLALQRGEEAANERLDDILSEGPDDTAPLIVKVNLALKNREVRTEAEVDALVQEIRGRLMEQVRAGARVRIV